MRPFVASTVRPCPDDGFGCCLPLLSCPLCFEGHVNRMLAGLTPTVLKGFLLMANVRKAATAAAKSTRPEPELLEGEIPTYLQAGFDEDFRTVVARKVKLAEKRKVLEAEEDDLKAQLLALLEAKDLKSVQVDDYRVIYSEGSKRKSLDPKLLMKNGVTAAVILKSTVETPGKPYVTVRATGAAE